MKKVKLSDILNGKIDDKLLARIDTIFNNYCINTGAFCHIFLS